MFEGQRNAACVKPCAQEADTVDNLHGGKLPREFHGWSRHAVISAALRRVYTILPEERASDLMQRLMHDFRQAED